MSKGTSLRQAFAGFGRGFEQMKADLLAARDELDRISAAIGTNDYLDPPDGGSVPLAEQVARMAKDAARYRKMRKCAIFQDRNGPGLYWYLPRWDRGLPVGERLDNALDADR